MPREQITHNPIIANPIEVPVETNAVGGDAIAPALIHEEQARRNLRVSWNRDAGWLQVAIDMTTAEIRSLLEHAERHLQEEVPDASLHVCTLPANGCRDRSRRHTRTAGSHVHDEATGCSVQT